jgi:hypothetical protein
VVLLAVVVLAAVVLAVVTTLEVAVVPETVVPIVTVVSDDPPAPRFGATGTSSVQAPARNTSAIASRSMPTAFIDWTSRA